MIVRNGKRSDSVLPIATLLLVGLSITLAYADAGQRACRAECGREGRACVSAFRDQLSAALVQCGNCGRSRPCQECRPRAWDIFRRKKAECTRSLRRDCRPCCGRGEGECAVTVCGDLVMSGPEACDPPGVLGPCGDGKVCNEVCLCPAHVRPPGTTTTTTTLTTRWTTSTTTSTVPAFCGDAIVNQSGEVCDGAHLNGRTCVSLGFPEGGPLGCRPDCVGFDTSDCYRCGNGQIENTEMCDGSNEGGQTCGSLGFPGGRLDCAGDCHGFETSGCWFCPNGRLEPLAGEQCDDGNSVAGDGCAPNCRSECGNGRLDGHEQCDDGNREGGDGCSGSCQNENFYGGGGDDDASDCLAVWAVEGVVAAPDVSCRDGAQPCDRDGVAGQCTFGVGYCLREAPFVGGGDPPDCVPGRITQFALTGSTTLDAATQALFLDDVAETIELDGFAVSRVDSVLHISPPLNVVGLCDVARLVVPVGPARVLDVETQATWFDASIQIDRDQILFSCLAQ